MYGFGDDRNPGNDTVNVMEEILIEFITDVVRLPFIYIDRIYPNYLAVPNSRRANKEDPFIRR